MGKPTFLNTFAPAVRTALELEDRAIWPQGTKRPFPDSATDFLHPPFTVIKNKNKQKKHLGLIVSQVVFNKLIVY